MPVGQVADSGTFLSGLLLPRTMSGKHSLLCKYLNIQPVFDCGYLWKVYF